MISSKILVPLAVGLACLIALVMGANLAVDAGTTLVYAGTTGCGLLLILFARQYWWIALFVGAAFGGYAYFGFRLYAHEAVLSVTLVGLIPSIALNPTSPYSANRPRLPWFFYALGVYLFVHIVLSVWWNSPRGIIEYGNIGRAYVYGLWPLLFVLLFRSYGRSEYFPLAIYMLQATYLLRAAIVFLSAFFPSAMVLPGINFLLPGTAMGSGFDDLRWSGYGLCLTSVVILLSSPAPSQRLWQMIILAIAFWALLQSGGRVLLVSGILVTIVALAAARKWFLLGLIGAGVVSVVVFLNLFPDALYSVTPRAQRALSILIVGYRDTSAYNAVEGSDLWHDRLEQLGYDRWTSSLGNLLLGTGIIPWDASAFRETNQQLAFEALLQGAANTGNYESALWTILAVSGLVGFGLCVVTLFYFARGSIKLLYAGRLEGFSLSAAFLSFYVPAHWLVFSPRLGGFPGLELLMAAVAFYYLRDAESSGETREKHISDDDRSSLYSEGEQ